MNKNKLYVDMDGTLCKWEWVGPDVFTSKGYFRNRPEIPTVVEAIKALAKTEGITVYILSAVLQDNHSIKEKNEWLDEYLGDVIPEENRIFVPYGNSKSDYVSIEANCFLLDDYNPNLIEWTAQGGVAVKILNGVNGSTDLWNGYMVDHRSSGEAIANSIRGIMAVTSVAA